MDVDAEEPVVLAHAPVGGLLGGEAGAGHGAGVEDVDEDDVTLDDLDQVGIENVGRRVIAKELCAAARGTVKVAGEWGREEKRNGT